jgi:hypothetical protein
MRARVKPRKSGKPRTPLERRGTGDIVSLVEEAGSWELGGRSWELGVRLAGMTLGWVVLVLAPVMVAAQTAVAPGTTAGPVQVYANAELHLTFSYPADLAPVDAAAVAAVGRRMVYGANEESDDPDHPKADACTKVLLSVGKGSERQAGTWVRLGVLDENAQCFPAKVFQNKKATDALLRNLVKQGTTVMGMMPVEEPVGYLMQGHRAGFCAAQGAPVTGSDVQTGGDQLIGVVAVAVDGHVLGWVLESNDPATLNRLLGSGVDFGAGKVERLFPGVAQ